MKTFWTTFYSYKGGVGRSLALANVAAILVNRGNKVVLLDFDLEAPSLDSFTEFSDAKGKPGIVEYVAEFQRTESASAIQPFVHPIHLPEHIRGKLWIMPAGKKDDNYTRLLAQIRWAELYEKKLGAPFIENWKLSIEQTFEPDYVLIDSRTGLTEVGGVCTTAFPDLVVMMFGLNDQNVQGTATVARSIRNANLDRPPQLHFVATPLPNLPLDRNGLLMGRWLDAEKKLGIEIGQSVIHYWASAALAENLFALNPAFADVPMVRDHAALADRITTFNRNGIDFLAAQAKELVNKSDSVLATKLDQVLATEFPLRAESLAMRADIARYSGRTADGIRLLEDALTLDPAYERPLDILLSHYRQTEQYDKMEEKLQLLLKHANRISTRRKLIVWNLLAELYMASTRFELAGNQYKCLFDHYKGKEMEEAPIFERLSAWFNFAEACRRSRRPVKPDMWLSIVRLFENTPAVEGQPNLTANRYQAMHIPYALIGDIEKAKDCLRKSKRLTATLNDFDVVFSVRHYRWMPPSKIMELTDELLKALEKNELWDGTKLQPRGQIATAARR